MSSHLLLIKRLTFIINSTCLNEDYLIEKSLDGIDKISFQNQIFEIMINRVKYFQWKTKTDVYMNEQSRRDKCDRSLSVVDRSFKRLNFKSIPTNFITKKKKREKE